MRVCKRMQSRSTLQTALPFLLEVTMASADSLRKSFTYRRWTPWALPLRTYQEKFSMHTRFCPQAQPTRACCEGLALRAISLRTSLLSGCAALNSKNTWSLLLLAIVMQAVQHYHACEHAGRSAWCHLHSLHSFRYFFPDNDADDDDCDFRFQISDSDFRF